MSENRGPVDLREAVERSYRVQWGGKRFCLVTAIVLAVLAVASAVVLAVARHWFVITAASLQVVEISALTTSFVCLIAGVMFALEAIIRWQREQGGQLPDRAIHSALCLSAVTVACLLFLAFLFAVTWESSGMGASIVRIAKFIIFLFCGMSWLGSVVMSSAAVALLVTRRSDLLEVSNTSEGTGLLFRRGHSVEITKLSIAAFIPLIVFVVVLLIVGSAYIL